MDANLPFGTWVRKRRKALDLTQTMLANKVGCSLALIVKIESGERRPSTQVAGLLAAALDIPTEDKPAFLKVARGQKASFSGDAGTQQLSQRRPHNMPIPSTQLVGREEELREIVNLLENPECRLVTIVGMGGIGKTRLVIESGMRMGDSFSQGSYFLALAGIAAPEYLPSEIVDALGIKLDEGDDPVKRLLDYLQDKKLLLILDNFEHILEGGKLVADILERAPGVKLLISSRESLSLRGEWLFEIKGLPVDAPGEEFASASAMALFLQVASHSWKKFMVKEEDGPAIEKICRVLGGNPLAIELAATWTRTLSCQEIVQEIEKDLDFLSATVRDLPERHSSMGVVFYHSWRLLTKNQRNILMKLSVFRGGFTRPAAEHVAGASLQALSQLVMKSLIQRGRGERFEIHEVVRRYATRQLEFADEQAQTQKLHTSYFTEFVENATRSQASQMTSSFDELNHETDNLHASLGYAIELNDSQAALRLGHALLRFWRRRGLVAEARRWLDVLMDLPVIDTNEYYMLRANLLADAGMLARIQGDFAVAHRMHEESLAVRRRIQHVDGIAASLNSLGILNMFEGHYALAEAYFQECLTIYRELGNKSMVASKLNNLGVNTMYQGQYEKARSIYEEALQTSRELGNQYDVAGALGNLGDVLRRLGEYDLAMQRLEESLKLFQEMGDVHGSIITLGSMARLYIAKGDIRQALFTFKTSLFLNREVGDKVEVALALEGIAEALGASPANSSDSGSEIRYAVRYLSAANQLRKTIGFSRPAVERPEIERSTERLRGRVSGEVFKMETEAGAVMTAEEAVESASSYLSEKFIQE